MNTVKDVVVSKGKVLPGYFLAIPSSLVAPLEQFLASFNLTVARILHFDPIR